MQANQPPDDPLASLLIDSKEVDRAEIAQTLRDIIAIDSTSGTVVFRPSSRRLAARERVLAYLLGRKVSVLLGKIEVEPAKPKTIIEETGIPAGTVHPTLKALRGERLVSQDDDGAYFVAQHQLQEALVRIKTDGSTS